MFSRYRAVRCAAAVLALSLAAGGLVAGSTPAGAQLAELDLTFSGDGKLDVFTSPAALDTVIAAAPDALGGIVAVRATDDDSGVEIAAVTSGGTLDTSFSGDGRHVLSYPGLAPVVPVAVGVTPDRTIVLLISDGGAATADPSRFVRLSSTGTVLSDVPVPRKYGTGHYALPGGWVMPTPDGGFVVVSKFDLAGCCWETAETVWSKFDSNGAQDTAYGADHLGYNGSGFTWDCLASQADGKIIAVSAGLTRYMPNGAYDAAFTQSFLAGDEYCQRVRVAPDGAITVLVYSGAASQYRLHHFRADGTVDVAKPSITIPSLPGNAVAAQGSGWFIHDSSTRAIRFMNSAGQLDSTYAGDGAATYAAANSPAVTAERFIVDSNGRPVLLGVPSGTSTVTAVRAFKVLDNPWIVAPKDTVGSSLPGTTAVADPVNTASGNLTDSFVDLPGEGFGLDVIRSYNGFADAPSPLGVHWSITTGTRLSAEGDAIIATAPDGTRFKFVPDGAGGWVTPDGFRAKLVNDPATPIGGGALPMLRLDHTDGTVEKFETNGRLVTITDWAGVSATSTYSPSGKLKTVTASTGQTVTFTYNGAQLLNVATSSGRTVAYGYDPVSGLLASVTDEHGSMWTYTWWPDGRLKEAKDPVGALIMSNAYDTEGRVVWQQGPSGGVTQFEYVAGTRQTKITDSVTASTVVYDHDAEGKVISITDPFNNVTTRIYDDTSNLRFITGRDGQTAEATYDAAGNVASTTYPGAGTTIFEFDTSNRLTSTTDPWGFKTIYGYDGTERVASTITDPLGFITTYDVVNGLVMSRTDADGVKVTYQYDTARRPTKMIDAYLNTTTTAYDAKGRVWTVTSPSGQVTTNVYKPNGLLESVSAPGSGTITYSYDAAGRVKTITDPTGAITTNTYNTAGLLETVLDPGGYTTTYSYDATGQLKTVTYPDGGIRTTDYGSLGRVTGEKDQLNRATGYDFDPEGRPNKTTTPDGGIRTQHYDNAGNVWKTVDPAGRETITTYDTRGRVDKVTAPGNRVTTYGYDNVGRTKTVTNPRGGTATTTYTPAGRIKTETNAAGLVTTYVYDLAGRLEKTIAPGALTTVYGYDTESRVNKITSPAGRITNLTYDPAGRIWTVTDPAGVVTTRTWSNRGELLTEKTGAEGTKIWEYNPDRTLKSVTDARGYKTSFGYDNRGNRNSRTNAAGGIETWKYNTANELTEYKDQLGRITTYTYDPNGRPKTVTDPAGRVTTLEYNPDGTPKSTAYLNGATITYGYNPDGTLATVTDPTGIYNYTYDTAGSLASETTPTGRTTRWIYDTAGRRTSLTYPDGTSYLYAYDTAGRLSTITPAELAADTFTQTGTTPDSNSWTTTVASGATAAVNANALKLTWANTTGSAATVANKTAAATNHDIIATYQFTVTGATNTAKLSVRARSTATTNIRVEIPSGSTTASIINQTAAGTSTTLGTFSVPADTAAHKIRLRVNNLDVKVKVWDPVVVEPTAWTKAVTITGTAGTGVADINVTRTAGTGAVVIDDWRQLWPSTPQTTEVTYGYNTDGQLTTETLRGGSRTWAYDATNGRLTAFTEALPGLTRNTAFTYDATGRLATEATGGVTTTYGYDTGSQLLSSTPTTGTTYTWTYDKLGRRSTETVGAVKTSYQYNAASQLCWTTTATMPATPTCAAPPTGAITYSYDNSGRRLTETIAATNKATYTYDPAGRLAKTDRVNGATTTSTARTYTPDGRLNGITNTVGATATPWQFDWDITGGSTHQLLTITNGTTSRDLISGNGAWASTRTGSTTNAIGVDHYGSVLATTPVTNLARSTTYGAYGAATGTNTFDPRLGYRGELTLDNLVHLRARSLQPGLGAFTSRDALDGVNGTTTITNAYHYADNNPLANADPTGLRPTTTGFEPGAPAITDSNITPALGLAPLAPYLPAIPAIADGILTGGGAAGAGGAVGGGGAAAAGGGGATVGSVAVSGGVVLVFGTAIFGSTTGIDLPGRLPKICFAWCRDLEEAEREADEAEAHYHETLMKWRLRANDQDEADEVEARVAHDLGVKHELVTFRKKLGGEKGDMCAAHHIVPKAHRRAQPARDVLAMEHIDISVHDPRNGALIDSIGHHGLHTYQEIDRVNNAVVAAQATQAQVLAVLAEFKTEYESVHGCGKPK